MFFNFKKYRDPKLLNQYANNVKTLFSYCAYPNREPTLSDEAAVKAVFFFNSTKGIDFLKSDNLSSVDSIIYSVFLVRLFSYIIPGKSPINREKLAIFDKELLSNTRSIISALYGLPSGLVNEMCENRYSIYNKITEQNMKIENNKLLVAREEIIKSSIKTLCMIQLSNKSHPSYYPYSSEMLDPNSLLINEDLERIRLHIKQIPFYTKSLEEFMDDIIARIKDVLS